MVKLMRFKSLISLAIVIPALLVLPGCDSVNEALEWKQRYEVLHEKYNSLRVKYDELKANYEKAQKELSDLRANPQNYYKNMQIMLQDD